MIDWPLELEALYRRLAVDPAQWEERAAKEARALVEGRGAEFLAWARQDDRWALTVAEAATQVCAKPLEAAVFVVVEGMRERLIDDGLIDED